MALTKPQADMLADVQASGVKVYNGRARRTIEALEREGLVIADWDMRPHAKGSGIQFTEVITVKPAEPRRMEGWRFLVDFLKDIP